MITTNKSICPNCHTVFYDDSVFCSECGKPLVPAVDNPTPAVAETGIFSVESFFAERGYSCTFAERIAGSAVSGLAEKISENFRMKEMLLKTIRQALREKQTTIYYEYSASAACASEEQKLLRDLYKSHIVTKPYSNETNPGHIQFDVFSTPRIMNFLNGNFLEMYTDSILETIVCGIAEEYGYGDDYEIRTNVKLRKNNNPTQNDIDAELDHVFRIGPEVFWIEDKSGKNFDPGKYYRLGREIGLVPDRLLMVLLDCEDDDLESVSYFYECCVSDGCDIEEKIHELVRSVFERG